MVDGGNAGDPAGAASPFRPVLVEAGPDGGPAIAIVRGRPWPAGGTVPQVAVAFVPFGTRAQAVACLKWMDGRRDRWTVWGRMAPILGSETTAAFIREERARDAARLAEARSRTREERRRARTVSMACDMVRDRHVITLRRGDDAQPVLTMRLSGRVEQERVWDWLRWQSHRYADWHAACLAGDALGVEGRILEGMLLEERRVRRAGLAAGGRRPLRFWRGQEVDGGTDAQG